jgi:hypothetical protein
MKTKVNVRYISGRQEQFEIELYGGASAGTRLKDFVSNPTLVIQTEKELIIIPSTAIECITLPAPDSAEGTISSSTIHKGKRVT